MIGVPSVLTTFGGLALDARLASRLGGKRLTFLAVLAAVGPEGITRERLAALFWPESDAERSRAALKQLTYVYRGVFGADVILPGASHLVLNAAVVDSDVRRFLEAVGRGDHETAVAIQRGPFLDGIHTRVPELERWIESTRTRLSARKLASLEALRDAALSDFDLPRAIQWGEQVVGLDPANATAVLRLMEVLSQADRPADAVRVAERYAAWMQVEYDLPPEAAVASLGARLRRTVAARQSPSPETRDVLVSMDETPTDQSDADGRFVSPSSPTPDPARSRSALFRRAAFAISGGAMLGLVGVAVGRAIGQGPTSTDRWASSQADASVAVFPFRVVGGNADSAMGEALTLLLVAGLDGTGGVHAIDARAAVRTAERRSTPALADAGRAAASLGAQFFILGDVAETSGRLNASATVYASGSPDHPRASAHATGLTSDAATVADSLALELLVARGSAAPGRLVSSAARTTRSFQAFRQFLDGERAMRRGHYGEALTSFKAAVRADSNFALAHYRLSMAADWAAEGFTDEYSLRRVRALADRLPERERMLVLASEAWERGAVSEADEYLRHGLELFPGDPEALYQLGEVMFHSGASLGRPATDAGPLFRRVLEIEPDNVEALAHLARIQTSLGDVRAAESLSVRVGSLRGADDRLAAELRTMIHAARGDRPWITDTVAALAANGVEDLMILGSWRIPAASDSLRLAEPFARSVLATSSNPTNRLLARLRFSELAIDFGDLREALLRTEDEQLGRERLLAVRAYFVALPFVHVSDSVLAAYADSLETWDPPAPPSALARVNAAANGMTRDLVPYFQGLVAVRLGDTLGVKRMAARLAEPGPTPEVAALAARMAVHLRAEVALMRGDLPTAFAAFDSATTGIPLALRLSAWGSAGLPRYRHAEALRTAGRFEEALRWYGSFDSDGGGELLFRVSAAKGRALALAALGRTAEAARESARARRLGQ